MRLARSGRRDSDPRPPAPHAGALPGCATPRDSGKYTPTAGERTISRGSDALTTVETRHRRRALAIPLRIAAGSRAVSVVVRSRPRDAGQIRLGRGCGGGAPASNRRPPAGEPIPERSVGPPRRGRVRSQEGAADQARGGIGCKPVSPRSGAPKARLAAKEETRQAA